MISLFPSKKKKAKFEGINVLKGREDEVNYLIYYSEAGAEGEVVIFVDNEIDLDWEANGKISDLMDQEPLRASFTKILSGIATLEPIAHNWPSDLKLTSKRLLGEALASIFRKDIKGAYDALENAEKYINAKSIQVSRYWTLQGCLTAGVLAGIAGAFNVHARASILNLVGPTFYLLSLCFWSGCVGALFFVVMKLGDQLRVDSTAERYLHYLEAVARIIGGGIAGVLIGSMVKLGLFLPTFEQKGMEVLAMCTAAMIAGASERLAAGIIMQVENNQKNKQEIKHADH